MLPADVGNDVDEKRTKQKDLNLYFGFGYASVWCACVCDWGRCTLTSTRTMTPNALSVRPFLCYFF